MTTDGGEGAEVWDVLLNRPVRNIAQNGSYLAAALSSDGRSVVNISSDGVAFVRDSESGKRVALSHYDLGTDAAISFSLDGSKILGTDKSKARLWERGDGREIISLSRIKLASLSPDGSQIVTASDQTIDVWDIAAEEEVTMMPVRQGNLRSLVFSPNGRRIVMASERGSVGIWDFSRAVRERIIRTRENVVAANADPARVVTSSNESTAKIWISGKSDPIAMLGNSIGLNRAAFSPDGSKIIASGKESVEIWNAGTGSPLVRPSVENGKVTFAMFALKGSVVVAVQDYVAYIFDAATNNAIAMFSDDHMTLDDVAFSSDGSKMAAISKSNRLDTVIVWDVHTKVLLNKFQHSGIMAVGFMSNKSVIVATSEDNIAETWDGTTGTKIATMNGHQDLVTSAAFNETATRLLTGSRDSNRASVGYGDGKGNSQAAWDER